MAYNKYFRVVFGMRFDGIYWRTDYLDTITFSTSTGERSVSMYARYVDGVYREVVTGIELPQVLYKNIPGFGTYELKSLCTIGAYAQMKEDIDLSIKNIEAFKEAIEREKSILDKHHDKYTATLGITIDNVEKKFGEGFLKSEQARLEALVASIDSSLGKQFGDK